MYYVSIKTLPTLSASLRCVAALKVWDASKWKEVLTFLTILIWFAISCGPAFSFGQPSTNKSNTQFLVEISEMCLAVFSNWMVMAHTGALDLVLGWLNMQRGPVLPALDIKRKRETNLSSFKPLIRGFSKTPNYMASPACSSIHLHLCYKYNVF
jgi:hypothetical protein